MGDEKELSSRGYLALGIGYSLLASEGMMLFISITASLRGRHLKGREEGSLSAKREERARSAIGRRDYVLPPTIALRLPPLSTPATQAK